MAVLPCMVVALLVSTRVASGSEARFEGLDPLAWATEPHTRTSHSATMSVDEVDGAADYRFICAEDASKTRPWTADASYDADGLTPETRYTFTAEVRAEGGTPRSPSSAFTVTTRVADEFDDVVTDGSELIPIMVHGDKDNRVNIVVVNRWRVGEEDPYNRPELRARFIQDVRDVIEPAFEPGGSQAVAPFTTQREFYNVYALWWPGVPPWDPEARDRGEHASHWETYNEMRARLFLPWSTEGRGWVTHLAMVNSRGGGGGAGLTPEKRIGDAMIEGNEIDAFYHEFAHTALRLGDKYIGWGMWGRADESSNTTLVYQRDKVKWRKWIAPTTPVPTPYRRAYIGDVGLFEGGTHRAAHIFRSTPVCTMGVNQFSDGLCALCVQSAAQRVYEYVDPLEHARPSRSSLVLTSPGSTRFSIERVRSTPDTQHIVWTVNGRTVAENVDGIDVELGALEEYDVVCTLVDRIRHVREDPPFALYPRAEKRWHVTNRNPTSDAPPLRATLTPKHPSVLGVDDASISATVIGGTPPYTYAWSNGELGATAVGLAAGEYSVHIVDTEFRTIGAETTLVRPEPMVVTPRSERKNGAWDIVVGIAGVDSADVTCDWSTGASGLALREVSDGAYSYSVTHATGVTITGELHLVAPTEELVVSDDLTPSTGSNDGTVSLVISDGRAPYNVSWADGSDEGTTRRFLPPGDYEATVRDANSTEIRRAITIEQAAPFDLGRPSFTSTADGTLTIDGGEDYTYLWYSEDSPTYILPAPRGVYEGTFTTADGRVVEADGAVIPNTNGKWANPSDPVDEEHREHNREHNDHGSWVRLDAYVDGRTALPMTVRLACDDDGTPGRAIAVQGETSRSRTTSEVTGEGAWQGTAENGRLTVTGVGPDAGRFDLLYTTRHENPSDPLHVGREFRPPGSGGYYVAARRRSDGAVSRNRVGVHVQVGQLRDVTATPVAPNHVTGASLLLWLDAADMDGDGVADTPSWPRGSLLGWRGKPGAMSPTSFVICEPNALNGMPVADWQHIWMQNLDEPVAGYQTIIMVYRDHDLSKPGSGPWLGVNASLWDMRGNVASADTTPESPQGRVWVNGNLVDPLATPAPMDFCVATFELAAPASQPIARTHTEWEGAVAEFIAYDGVLDDAERSGVEEYLRRKWLAEVTLAAAPGTSNEH